MPRRDRNAKVYCDHCDKEVSCSTWECHKKKTDLDNSLLVANPSTSSTSQHATVRYPRRSFDEYSLDSSQMEGASQPIDLEDGHYEHGEPVDVNETEYYSYKVSISIPGLSLIDVDSSRQLRQMRDSLQKGVMELQLLQNMLRRDKTKEYMLLGMMRRYQLLVRLGRGLRVEPSC